MALTPAQVDALPEYTNAQMVKLLRNNIAELASNPEATVQGLGGRAYTFRDMDQLKRLLQHFQQLAADDLDGANIAFSGAPVVSNQKPQI